jgi:hypothetical protein
MLLSPHYSLKQKLYIVMKRERAMFVSKREKIWRQERDTGYY